MPIESESFKNAIVEAFSLAKWYAQEHVLLCLVPAFFIAGVITVFVSQNSVIKYLGARAERWIAYLVASVSGTILAVCSCTVLPLFSGIHKRGAGLGPAIAFLYSGPAINILAIILTANVLGLELGIARIIGAVSFSAVIGVIMSFIYREEEKERAEAQLSLPEPEETKPIWQTAFHFFILVAILVLANWGKPDTTEGFWFWMSSNNKGEANEWLGESWGFAKQIMPLLGAGVLVAGFLLGTPEGGNGIIPNEWIANLVGGNSLFSNFFASITGAFMYFATLTEIPILQGLLSSGMGKGPALA
ncbi:unnamed protein product, partial [Cyprideis torosa]